MSLLNFELPDGWTLGRPTTSKTAGCKMVTLFYKEDWAEKFCVNVDLEQNILDTISNPPARVYPGLFKDNKLDFKRHKLDKGIWKLIDLGYITPKQGYDILPTPNFMRTAKRKGVWEESWANKSNYVHYNSRTYACKGGVWYDITEGEEPLPRKRIFHSVWEARVLFGRGEVSITDVAEYNLGAVLECIADRMTYNPSDGKSLYKDTVDVLEQAKSNPTLRGFSLGNGGIPVFSFTCSETNWTSFKVLLKDVCDLKRSGYEAHLVFTNGYNLTISLEHSRFIKAVSLLKTGGSPTRLIHVPFFRHLGEYLDSVSLTEARDYLQEKYSELFSIGPYSRGKRLVFFRRKGYSYGLWVDSGKIFRNRYDDRCYTIPFGYDKFSEERRRSYLGKYFDELDEKWCKQARKARRSYYYLTRCKGLSYKKARYILNHKHLRTDLIQFKYQNMIERVSCKSVNKSATPITITWGVERKVA